MKKKIVKKVTKKATKTNKASKAVGRPSGFSQDVADLICERLAEGESLRKICSNEDLPSITSVWRWLNTREEFSKQYARAREEQAEFLADEIISIADELMPVGIDGKIDSAAVNQARLKIDSRKWVASKLKPKRYGDSTTLKGDVDNPLKMDATINIIPVKAK